MYRLGLTSTFLNIMVDNHTRMAIGLAIFGTLSFVSILLIGIGHQNENHTVMATGLIMFIVTLCCGTCLGIITKRSSSGSRSGYYPVV
jgi:hypothetical protein